MSANYLDNLSIMPFNPMLICSRKRDVVITVGCPLLALGVGTFA